MPPNSAAIWAASHRCASSPCNYGETALQGCGLVGTVHSWQLGPARQFVLPLDLRCAMRTIEVAKTLQVAAGFEGRPSTHRRHRRENARRRSHGARDEDEEHGLGVVHGQRPSALGWQGRDSHSSHVEAPPTGHPEGGPPKLCAIMVAALHGHNAGRLIFEPMHMHVHLYDTHAYIHVHKYVYTYTYLHTCIDIVHT